MLAKQWPLWAPHLLTDHLDRARLLGIVRVGVSLSGFVDDTAGGEFCSSAYVGADLTPAAFEYHVRMEFASWIDSEVAVLVRRQCVVEWSSVADVTAVPHPTITLNLGFEPRKYACFGTDGGLTSCAGVWRNHNGRGRASRAVRVARRPPSDNKP